MSTVGAFNKKNPTIKRILKEASELANSTNPDCYAEPLESNLFEWHFTLRGPPAPSHYAGGLYHGRIVLPPSYPLRPPSFRFLTPTGRFEINREICLSISGHHEETWQPAWGIRTALVAIRSFMDTDSMGQLGGLVCDEGLRRRMAEESGAWQCTECCRSNRDIIREREEMADKLGGKGAAAEEDEKVPEELKLAFRDELQARSTSGDNASSSSTGDNPAYGSRQVQALRRPHVAAQAAVPARAVETSQSAARPAPSAVTARQYSNESEAIPAWIDKAIIGIITALALMVLRRIF